MFHFVLQGTGVLHGPDGQSHQLKSLNLALVPEGVPHTLECGTKAASVLNIQGPPAGAGVVRLVAGSGESADLQVACGMVKVSYGDSLGLFQRMREIAVADLAGYPQARVAFESILSEQGGTRQGSVALTQALMSQCLIYFLRSVSEESQSPLPWLLALEDPSLGRALDLIFEDPSTSHTVDSLADAANMSRSMFAERFHRAFGCPPITFLHDMRLRRAAVLLRQSTELSTERVAYRVGFRSRSHFSQAFKAHFGTSPAGFRKGQAPC